MRGKKDAAQYDTVQYSTLQHNTGQYDTAQYSTVQYSTEQYNTIQYSIQQSVVKRYLPPKAQRITIIPLATSPLLFPGTSTVIKLAMPMTER